MKILIAWTVIVILSIPFAGTLLSLTSYNIASGIVSSNSMAVRASNLLSEYFPAAAPSSSSQNNTVILTTGTNINDPSVISAYLSTQSLVKKFLNGLGVTGHLTSIVSIEQSTLYNFSTGALQLMNGTTVLAYSLNTRITQLNASLEGMLHVVYGIPALFLENLQKTGSSSQAYNATLAYIENQGALAVIYLNSFSGYFNSTSSNLTPYQRTEYSITQAVTNTSSPFEEATASSILGLIAQSVYQNFSLQDFNLDYSSNLTHYDQFSRNFMYGEVVPSLSLSAGKLLGALNITASSLFNSTLQLPQPADKQQLLSFSSNLVSNSLYASLRYNPLISVNLQELQHYLVYVNGTSNLNASILYFMQTAGFSSYPVMPSYYIFHDFVGTDNETTILLLSTSSPLTVAEENLLHDVVSTGFAYVGGSAVYIAGSSALSQELESEVSSGLVRALIIGIVLSIVIVGIYFRSLIAAFLPLGIFGVSAATAFSTNGLLYKYILKSHVSFITPTLMLILLLGLSTDYVVYIMSRYRRELLNGNPHPELKAGKWAGHAVFTSGITVSLSYVALWLSNVPLFSDSGITNAIGVAIAIIAANTLLLSILNRGGSRLFWPWGLRAREKGLMHRLSGTVTRHRNALLVLFVVVSIASLVFYSSVPTNFNVFNLLPSSSGIKAIQIVNQTFRGDYFDQSFAIIKLPSPLISGGQYNSGDLAMINSIETYLLHQPEISYVYGPTFPYGYYVPFNLSGIPASYQGTYRSAMDGYVASNGDYVLITFQLSSLSWLPSTYDYVGNLPHLLRPMLSPGASVYIGGLAEGLNNAYSFTSSSFSRLLPVLAIAIFAILALQLSSVFTPLRLILMVLASVVIALSITYALVHVYYSLPVIIFLPMFTVITLLAVGLDYDIFMVTRVREEVLQGRSDEEGISTSMAENGAVIVTLGTILFATFGALYFSGLQILQEIGAGLAFGVLIDTFVSWPFFVPSVMLFMRRLNWWPARLSRRN